jgi:hypothetical protein
MEIHVHIHHHADRSVDHKLDLIIKKLTKMPTKQEFQDALTEVTTALDNIAADITRLTDQLATGGLTDAEEQEVFTQLRAVADRAKQIADTTPEPETPEA